MCKKRKRKGEKQKKMSPKVKTQFTSSIVSIEINPEFTVEELKDLLHEKTGVEKKDQHLLFNGIALKDFIKAKKYHLKEGSDVHMIVGVGGG